MTINNTPEAQPEATASVQVPAPVPAVNHVAVKQSRDKAQYTRQQTGHSVIKHALLGMFVLWIPTIYYAASPNHYWHA